MKKNPEKIIAILYGVFFGLFGIHNFYRNKNKRGIIQAILGATSAILFSNMIALKIALTENILVDNLYTPMLIGGNLTLYKAYVFLTFALAIADIVILIYDLWHITKSRKIAIPEAKTKRYFILGLTLGITGIHDAINHRYKFAIQHIAITLIGIAIIVFGIIDGTIYAQIARITGLAIIIANEFICLIEGLGAIWYNKAKK